MPSSQGLLPAKPGSRARYGRLADLLRQWPWIYPRGIAASAREWIARARRRAGWYGGLRGEWLQTIHPEGSRVYTPPAGIPESARGAFNGVAARAFPEATVCFLPGAHLFSDTGMVLTKDNRVLGEYYHEFGVRSLRKAIYRRPFGLLGVDVRRVDGAVGLLSAPQGSNYYHWLFDVLPRFHLLERWRDVIGRFAVPSGIGSVHRESLGILGLGPDQLLLLNPRERLRCQNLYLPSLPGSEGCTPPWVLEFLRGRFLPASAGVAGRGPRIYVRRGPGSARPLLNEDEVVARLQQLGFQVVEPAHLSFREQIAAFRDARLIVAPHGAGLTNAVFSSNAGVLEFLSADYLRVDCYFALCRQAGHAYDCLIDERRASPTKQWGSLTVDVSSLEGRIDGLERSLDPRN